MIIAPTPADRQEVGGTSVRHAWNRGVEPIAPDDKALRSAAGRDGRSQNDGCREGRVSSASIAKKGARQHRYGAMPAVPYSARHRLVPGSGLHSRS